MKYRINQRTGDKISEIGLETAHIYEAGTKEAVRTLNKAFENGINYYDLATGNGARFPIFGEAFRDVRNKVMYQIHFGADYSNGEYGWTLDLETIKRSVDRQLTLNIRSEYKAINICYIIIKAIDVEPDTTVGRKGDINLDDKVDAKDAFLLQDYLLGKTTLNGEQTYAADILHDALTDIYDMVALRKAIVSSN